MITFIFGKIFSILGALCLAKGFFISDKQIIDISVPRYGSKDPLENLKSPQAKSMKQLRFWGIVGVLFTITSIFFDEQVFLLMNKLCQ
jgi:hypothetical protein